MEPSTQGGDEGARGWVLELARPAEWRPLGAVWKGVQTDLDLPAPAIAANGTDGLQLWFSMAEPLDAAQAQAFLDSLRLRYMADLPQHRVRWMPAPLAPPVPAPSKNEGHWSAFVAADLAPIFEESPWLDLPPGDEGQADLLSRLECIQRVHLEDALARLRAKPGTREDGAGAARAEAAPRAPAAAHPDAMQFLLKLMHDEAAPLALRVEAAKALLPFGQPMG